MSKFFIFFSRAARKAIHGPAEAFLLLRMAGWVLLLSIAVKVFPLPGRAPEIFLVVCFETGRTDRPEPLLQPSSTRDETALEIKGSEGITIRKARWLVTRDPN